MAVSRPIFAEKKWVLLFEPEGPEGNVSEDTENPVQEKEPRYDYTAKVVLFSRENESGEDHRRRCLTA